MSTTSADLDIASPSTDAPVLPSCGQQKETRRAQEAGADNGINPKATNAANSGMSRRRKIHIRWSQPQMDTKTIKTIKVNKKIKWNLSVRDLQNGCYCPLIYSRLTANLSIQLSSLALSAPTSFYLFLRLNAVFFFFFWVLIWTSAVRWEEAETRLSWREPPAAPDRYSHQQSRRLTAIGGRLLACLCPVRVCLPPCVYPPIT